jgi:hypothetical protein
MIRRNYVKKTLKVFLPLIQIFKYKLGIDRKAPIIKHIRKNKPNRILEIGVHQGDFAKRMVSGLNLKDLSRYEYTGIDLFAELQTTEIYNREVTLWPDSRNTVHSKLKLEFPELNIRLFAGFSDEQLGLLIGEKFDLIFIDGGHSQETVYKDWVLSQQLLGKDGVIYFDDYTNLKGLKNSGFGINYVVNEIDIRMWKVEIFRIRDWFLKDWGVLALRVVKIQRKF